MNFTLSYIIREKNICVFLVTELSETNNFRSLVQNAII